MNLSPKKGRDESFEQYKKRRKFNNLLIKLILKGKRVKMTNKEILKGD